MHWSEDWSNLYWRRIIRLGRAWAKKSSSSDNPSVYKYGQTDGSSVDEISRIVRLTRRTITIAWVDGWSVCFPGVCLPVAGFYYYLQIEIVFIMLKTLSVLSCKLVTLFLALFAQSSTGIPSGGSQVNLFITILRLKLWNKAITVKICSNAAQNLVNKVRKLSKIDIQDCSFLRGTPCTIKRGTGSDSCEWKFQKHILSTTSSSKGHSDASYFAEIAFVAISSSLNFNPHYDWLD